MTAKEYLRIRNIKQNELFQFCKPLPGVLKLVGHLKNNSIPIVVATSSYKSAFAVKSKNNMDLFKLFDGNILCGDDTRVKYGKPHPAIFLEAAKLIGNPKPENCLVFEDSESGVLAALNANMNVIWVPMEGVPLNPEISARCVQILGSIEDFDPLLYGLPGW